MNYQEAKNKFIEKKVAGGLTIEAAEKLWRSSQERFDLYDNRRLNIRREESEDVANSSETKWDDFHFNDL